MSLSKVFGQPSISGTISIVMFLMSFSVALGQTPVDWPQKGPWVVRAYYPDLEIGKEMASKLAPWEFNVEQGFFLLDVSIELMDKLVFEGFQLELDLKKTEKLATHMVRLPGQVTGIPGYPCYRTVEETYATAQQLQVDYPGLVEWIQTGDSWERVQNAANGYPLMVLHLTNLANAFSKPVVFILGAIHSRELTTAELNTRFAEYLLQNYGTDADVTWLLDYRDVYLVLQTNPDGRKKAETGLSWRKNTNSDECSSGTPPDGPGVDLNRNFPFQWACCGGSSSTPCSVTYHGTALTSEPESQAVVSFSRTVIPDQRADDLVTVAPEDTEGVFLDLHSYGGDVLWPWGFDPSREPPNAAGLYGYAKKLAYFNGYSPHGSTGSVDGSTKDFAYGEFGVPAYTIELGSTFFQDCSVFESTIFPDNLPMLIYVAKSSEAPYMIGKGPNSFDLQYAQSGQAQGVVSATFDDSLYNISNGSEPIQNVVEARLSIGVPPTETGANPVAMVPVDGVWDNPRESAEVPIDLTALGVGSHPVFVQGKDMDGNWGIVSSMFVHVLSPTTYIQGTVREVGSLAPLECLVQAGDFQTHSDATGYYQLFVTPGTYSLVFSSVGYKTHSESVTIVENQVVSRSVQLKPFCLLYSEDGEQGMNGWTADGSWALSTEDAHTGSFSWVDSPGGNYASSTQTYLVSPVYDLTDALDVKLSFWNHFDLESTYDFVHLEYSLNGGTSWDRMTSFSGTQLDWQQFSVAVPQWDGQASVQVRFYFDSDSSVVKDGFYMDDLEILGTGSFCSPVLTWEFLLLNWPEHSIDELVNYLNNPPG